MLNFRKITAHDKKWISECIAQGNTDGACYCFGNLFCWGEQYGLEIAEYEGMCLMRSDFGGKFSYAYPSGQGDIKGAIVAMMDDAALAGQPFRMHQLLEVNKAELEALFPDYFSFRYDRDSSEYVYSVKNMAELPGKKFHGKKGHVNAFFRRHTDISCDPITKDNIHLCLDIAKSWLSGKDSEDEELLHEFNALSKSVKYFDMLGFMGAILYADGKPVAFTMGEQLKNNTFCTHYEKTIPDYRDAFPVINNGFTKLMLTEFEYVNREEDTGAEGLRKAKLSYYPEFLLDKYTLRIKNDPSRDFYADENDFDELSQLWCDVFGDDKIYPDKFLIDCVNSSDIYAYREDGKIVSAFYLIDVQLVSFNKRFSGKYLYAAATHPSYRSKGIMQSMIAGTASELKKNGIDFICLYPAEESLYGYYKKLGFKNIFSERVYTIEKGSLSHLNSSRYFNCSADYSGIRNCVPSENYITFDAGYTDFARFCAKNTGFEISVAFDDEDKVFIIGSKQENAAVIEEAISSDCNYQHILSVLSDVDCDIIKLKTPVCISLDYGTSEIKESGMMLMLNDELEQLRDIYLGQPCM